MKTKEAILVTARKVLNRDGYQAVTIRHIAAEMAISHGNLGYHYPNLTAIVKALYDELVTSMDAVVGQASSGPVELEELYRQLQGVFSQFYEYRFFFLDFVAIGRNIPEIKTHYAQLQLFREQQFLEMIHRMIDKGLINNGYPEEQFIQFIRSLTVMADYWLSAASIHYGLKSPEVVNRYVNLFFSMWRPYFTPSGVAAYEKVLQNASVV